MDHLTRTIWFLEVSKYVIGSYPMHSKLVYHDSKGILASAGYNHIRALTGKPFSYVYPQATGGACN